MVEIPEPRHGKASANGTPRRRKSSASKREFKLPQVLARQLKTMGLSGQVHKLKRIMRGDDPTLRQVERLCPPTTKLNELFGSVSPKLSPEIFGRVVASFWTSQVCAVTLSENLHELARINGRAGREELRLLLGQIYEVALAGQRRQVEGLRRDIPRLIRELGGAPSGELLSPPKERSRQ
jgi:hypothetical protein